MRFYFLELLACPKCKSANLKLFVLKEEVREIRSPLEKLRCKRFCGLYRRPAEETPIDLCKECVRRVIVDGVIVCLDCNRWYPIIDSIPVMLPDKYRGGPEDRSFLKKYWNSLSEDLKTVMKEPEPKGLLG
ncbi:MAG: Trm112 family protein [Acidilobaceae archaeon]